MQLAALCKAGGAAARLDIRVGTVVICGSMRSDPRTRPYVDKRTALGLSEREIMRCLKRYIARDLYPLILLSQTA